MTSSLEMPARLARSLDRLAVTDHAENLDLPTALNSGDPVMQSNDWNRSISKAFEPRTIDAVLEAYDIWFGEVNIPGATDPMAETYWAKTTKAAKRRYQPGAFATFIGFDWTSSPTGNNLHRNVISRDGKDKTNQILPLSSYDTEVPEKLWDWLQACEDKTGGQVLALAHNGNLSNGLMFDDVTLSAEPLSVDYAARRQRWEPIYEVT